MIEQDVRYQIDRSLGANGWMKEFYIIKFMIGIKLCLRQIGFTVEIHSNY